MIHRCVLGRQGTHRHHGYRKNWSHSRSILPHVDAHHAVSPGSLAMPADVSH